MIKERKKTAQTRFKSDFISRNFFSLIRGMNEYFAHLGKNFCDFCILFSIIVIYFIKDDVIEISSIVRTRKTKLVLMMPIIVTGILIERL